MMKKLLLGSILGLAFASEASAQCSGIFSPGDFCGIPQASSAGTARRMGRTESGVREKLAADRTYYVRPSGNDTNCSGLVNANDPGTGTLPRACAFQTPQKASDTVAFTLDLNGKSVTVDLQGAFTSRFSCRSPLVGSGLLILTASVASSITTADINAIEASNGCQLRVTGANNLTLSTTTATTNAPNTIGAWAYGRVEFSGVTFGASAGAHLQAGFLRAVGEIGIDSLIGPGTIVATGNYTISGGGLSHMHVTAAGAQININTGVTVTLTGTPNFSAYFVGVTAGFVYTNGATFSGAATGKRYYTHRNGVIVSNTASRTYFPGNVTGESIGGGLYASQDDTLSEYGVDNVIGLRSANYGNPAANYSRMWFDSTDLRLHDINSTGSIGTTVVASTAVANQFVTGISSAGVVSRAQPTGADLAATPIFSGSAAADNFTSLGTGGVAGNFTSVGGTQPATPPAGRTRYFTDASARFSLLYPDGFARSFGGTLTANRVYTLPDSSINVASEAYIGIVRSITINVNFAVAGDNSITITLPPGSSRYQVQNVGISGASASLVAATFGVFTAAGGGGAAVVAAGTAITVSTSAENTANNLQQVAGSATTSYNAATLFFRVGATTAATANVTINVRPY